MNNSLVYKITYTFHKIGFYYYSIKYYVEDNKENGIITSLIKGIIRQAKIFNYKYGYYEYLEIPITTKCSLKCLGCSNLIPCYNKPSDIDLDILIKSINNFLEIIENIVYIRILGGEPFLSKNICEVIEILLKSKKIQRIEVVTNGTIIPNDKRLLKLLKNKKIRISISKYPNVNIEKLIDKLKENNIFYKIDKITYWMDYGEVKKKNRNQKDLLKQYKRCNHICKSMLKGEIHICPRSSHGKDLGIIPVSEEDYLNILDDNMSNIEKKNKFNELLNKKLITACDYCDFETNNSKKIEVAKQIERRTKK